MYDVSESFRCRKLSVELQTSQVATAPFRDTLAILGQTPKPLPIDVEESQRQPLSVGTNTRKM